MDSELEGQHYDAIAYLTLQISQLKAALAQISEIDEDYQALVYDALCDVGYYEQDEDN